MIAVSTHWVLSSSSLCILLNCLIWLSFPFISLKNTLSSFPKIILVFWYRDSWSPSLSHQKGIQNNESSLKLITSSDFYWKMENWISSQNKKIIIWNSSVIMVTIFSSPDPKDHVRYCHHLASVVRPLTFSYFNLLLWNNWAKWNQTWQKASI